MNDTNLKTYIFRKASLYKALTGIGILIALYIVSRQNYLVFHTMAEFFSIAVAGSLFLIFWNTKEIIENKPLILLGIAYLFIGSIDLVHTLSYKGMGVLGPETGANPATQLWIFARYMESLSLFIFSAITIKRINTARVMLSYGAILTLGLLSIFYWKIFPICYVDGAGLTNFKIFSEYLICGILILSLLLFTKKKALFDETVYHCMVAAIILTILAELAFTSYVDVYSLSNLFGHYFKIISFYFIYKALIQSGLTRPFATLFRDMEKEKEALRASEDRYRSITETVNEGIILRSASGEILTWNQGAENILGITAKAAIGTTSAVKDLSAIHQDGSKYEQGNAPSVRTLGTGKAHRNEIIGIYRPSGEFRWISVNTNPMFKENENKPYAVAISFSDITELEKNRKELEESRAMFQAAMDHSHAGIAIAEAPDGKFLYVNDSALNIRGESKEKIVNGVDAAEYVSSWRIFHFDGTPYRQEEVPLTRAILYGEVCTEEFVVRRSDQEDRIVWANAAPIKNDHGEIIYGIVVFLDITERNRAEAALKKSEEKYRVLFESSKDPVYISTLGGNVLDANPSFFALFGYKKDDLGQLKIQDLYVNPDDRAEFIKELNKFGFVKDYLETLQSKSGFEMDCRVTATVRRSVDGDIIGYQGTIRDISEIRRKELEKEQLIFDLQEALAEVKKLSGLLPICMHCKKIRDDKGYWNQIEAYIHKHSDAEFSHSICKDCAEKHYPDMDIYDDE